MAKVITRTIKVNGTLTDATTVKLSDPTGTYGVKRNDTDAVVVADGTAMTHVGTGQYSYTFDEPAAGLAYTAYVEVVYAGATYHDEVTLGATTDGSLGMDYDRLRREIGRYLDYGRDPADWDANQIVDVADILDQGLTQFYYPATPSLTRGWSFLRPRARMTLSAPYNTGTVAVVDGVATVTDGTVPTWAAGAELWVAGVRYEIESRDGDTQVTLYDTTVDVDAGTAYELIRCAYDLPADLEMIEAPMLYAPGAGGLYAAVQQVPEYQVQYNFSQWGYKGRPSQFAVRAKAGNPQLGTRYEVVFAPRADDAYPLSYRYTVQPLPLDSTNRVPYGGHAHGTTVMESCLAAAEVMMNDGGNGLHQQRFEKFLAASILHDAKVDSPPTLGRLPDDWGDREAPPDIHDIHPLVVRYMGQVYY